MSICKIGETKVINGKRYRKEAATSVCEGCAFSDKISHCLIFRALPGDRAGHESLTPIEEGGRECAGSIWILADEHPEAPTATPPRDEVREQRRFEAAVAAMQGAYESVMAVTPSATAGQSANIAKIAVALADALLAELDRTGAGK